jgi:hypothetical protein
MWRPSEIAPRAGREVRRHPTILSIVCPLEAAGGEEAAEPTAPGGSPRVFTIFLRRFS